MIIISIDTKSHTITIDTKATQLNNIVDGNGMIHDDGNGEFTGSTGGGKKKSKTKKDKRAEIPKLGRKRNLRGKRISRQELGTIKTDLFKNYNEVEAKAGDEYPCKTSKYKYIIRLNEDGNLANFSPLFRWRLK